MSKLGHNDATHVYCGLCQWRWPISSFEHAEAILQTHLYVWHGRTLTYAVETETGAVKPTPTREDE